MQRYQVVTQNDIERIHETSLRIMEEIGVVFSYEPARNILAKGGAKVDGKTVRFPPEMVERNLKIIPSSFKLHARNPKKDVEINTRDTAYAGPNCPPFVLDLDKGRRYSSLEDFNNLAKLCQILDNINIQSQIYCEPNDVDVKIRHLEMTYSSLKYNEKPLMGSSLGYQDAKDCIEMAAIAHGGIDAVKARPIMASIPCTLTPLSYDDKMAGAIIAYAEYGQPQLVNSLSIAGATNVVTIAGAVALQNAEILAGIVLAQLVNPGTPIVYSAASSNAEMRNGSLSVGSPEHALFCLINGQLAKYYNLPCRLGGANSDSKCVDAQAGYETMMNLLMAQMAGANFFLHGGGILEAYNCISFEKLMVDDEVMGMVRRIGRGVEVNEETLAFDVIKEVGPQGAFIDHDHTFEHFRTEFYQPVLSDRNNPIAWKEQGSLTAEQRANARWKKLLSEYEEPKLPADVDRDLRKFIEKRK